MSGKSIFRLVLAGVVVVGYLVVPWMLSAGSPLNVSPVKVDKLTVTGLAGGDIGATRADQGVWESSRPGMRADANVIANLLASLGKAAWKRSDAAFKSSGVTLTLGAGSKSCPLELGQRLHAFRSQLVRLDGKVYEVAADLNAHLGIWIAEKPMGNFALLDPVVADHGDKDIVKLEFSGPLGRYVFERTDKYSEVRSGEEEGDTIRVYEWRVAAPAANLKARKAMLQMCQKRLQLLNVAGTADDVKSPEPFLRKGIVSTAAGVAYEYELTGAINAQGDHLLRLVSPRQGVYLVGANAWQNLAPAGGTLIEGLPRFSFKAADVAAIVGEREGHRFELQREKNTWTMPKPSVKYKIWSPPAEPGQPKQTTVDSFLKNLENLESLEYVDPKAQAQTIQQHTRQVQAKLSLRLNNGSTLELTLYAPIPGTGESFLKAGNQLLVQEQNFGEALVPEPGTFFNPDDLAGAEIKW